MKLVLVVALAACSSGSKPDPAVDARAACAAAMDRSIDLTLAKRKGRAVDVSALAPKMKAAMTELCITDQWPADVVACFQTSDDMAGCRDKLKPEHRQRFTAEAMKIRASEISATLKAQRARSGSGSGSGSDSGSGGSTIAPLP